MTTFTPKRMALSSAATIALAMAAPYAIADPVQFDIAEGTNLQAALAQFANQSDVEILYSSDIVNGKMAPALSGPYEPEAGLALLLAGSGLDFSQSASGTLIIAQAETAQIPASTTNTGPTSTGEPVSVEGTVKGAITDSNLAGARVEIVETGQVTATDNLGRFRFPVVAPGTYTLRISYLGRETIEQRIDLTSGGDFVQNYAMGFPTTVSVTSRVDVVGSRSARAQARNIERTAENSKTVVSADALGSFNGTTISEALRRAPGIAFVPDANTGDGANVIVRGVEPDLNQVTLNGIRLLDGSGLGRSPDLSGLLTENIDSVTINTSLLPSDDTNGAGALIEIETKSPLDRPPRFASFTLESGGLENDFNEEFLASGTVSGTFGAAQDFGISLSASFRDREVSQANYSLSDLQFGEYLPEGVSSPTEVDVLDIFPFDGGGREVYPRSVFTQESYTENEQFLLTGSVQKLIASHTDLRFDVTYTQQKTETYSATTPFTSTLGYLELPIDELNGEERFALLTESPFEPGSFSELQFGPGINATVSRFVDWSPEVENESLNISFRGTTDMGPWTFDYGAGFTDSSSESVGTNRLNINTQGLPSLGFFPSNTRLEPELLTDSARSNTRNGRIVSIFEPLTPGDENVFVLPALNDAGFAFYNDTENLTVFNLTDGRPSQGSGEAITLSSSARYNFEHDMFRYIEAGFNYQNTEFEDQGGVGTQLRYSTGTNEVLASDIGIEFAPSILQSFGAAGGFNGISRSSVEAFFRNPDPFVSDDLLTLTEEELDAFNAFSDLRGRNSTGEETLAVYVQGKGEIGKLELIGGVRVERLELTSEFLQSPEVRVGLTIDPTLTEDFIEFVSESVSQTDILPRIQANYRFNEDMIARGSYYTTVSRPQLRLLTSRRNYFRSVATPAFPFFGNQVTVTQGNPDLEPATTHNFGLGWEWYTGDVGVIKVNAFYKAIENPLQSVQELGGEDLLIDDVSVPNIPEFTDLPDGTRVTITTPENGDNTDELYGIEFEIERQLDFLPEGYNGLGILLNATFTESSSERRLARGLEDVILEDIPFDGSPEYQGTAGLTYAGYGIDASLLYTIQDRRLAGFAGSGLSRFEEEIDTLDLRIDYTTEFQGATYRLFLRGEDLLKGSDDPYLKTSTGGDFGAPTYFDSARFFGGRSFFAGLSASF